ncbi:UNVERIFIED_CONTAM: hypothetical protein PYX00_011491 [Menopon gallinae]|uniref:CMP/dCMP-type deaminase domain-containing protein n=1 Tax=Menopon gallinae TaxID=328185 RepID=A0AAW2H7X5_9NEOP
MSILNLDHTCREVDLPLCRVIKAQACKYTSRKAPIGAMDVHSPSTVALLLVALLCSLRLLVNTKRHYAAIGRKELVLFFYMYIGCLSIDTILISGIELESTVYTYLTTMQLSLAATALFSLFVSGITSAVFSDIGILKSIVVVRVLSFVYFLVVGAVTLAGLVSKNGVVLFFLLFVLNLCIALCYIVSQLILLTRNDSEVWAYGTLAVAAMFFVPAVAVLLYGANHVSFWSERYLDGLFVFHLFMFCTIIMVHKRDLAHTSIYCLALSKSMASLRPAHLETEIRVERLETPEEAACVELVPSVALEADVLDVGELLRVVSRHRLPRHIKRVKKTAQPGKALVLVGFKHALRDCDMTMFCKHRAVDVMVPKDMPVTQKQNTECQKHWPCYYFCRKVFPDVDASHVQGMLADLLGRSRALRNTFCSGICTIFQDGAAVHSEVDTDNVVGHAVMKSVSAASRRGAGYLCTGLDAFVYREPCVSCAMAFVHGRISRVFFVEERPHGPYTHLRLCYNKSLNHRYPVYQIALAETPVPQSRI